jgi:BTB/POZ domain
MKVANDDFVGLMAANLLSRGEGGNLEFVTTDGKSLFAHRGVLSMRSHYFEASTRQ